MNDKKQYFVFPLLIVLFTAFRWPGLMPVEMMGFSPVYAIFFCAGLYLRSGRAWLGLLAMMFISDVVVTYGFHKGHSLMFSFMASNYAMYLLIGLAGWLMHRQKQMPILIGGSVLAAGLFYLVSNTVSWMGDPGYSHTWAGWVQAITVGKPTAFPPAWMFFRNTIASSALFVGAIVGAVKWMEARAHAAKVKRGELLGADA